MTTNITFIFKEVKTKLTRLGMALFYFYLLLALVGCAGVVYGIVTLIFKFIITSPFDTPLLEIIALIVVSWFMAKIFLRESLGLIGRDIFQGARESKKSVEQEEQQLNKSNVISFDKISKRF